MHPVEGFAWTLVAALATVWLGTRINQRLGWLDRLHVPPAVSAGLLLSLLLNALRHAGVMDLRLDVMPRDVLLLVFFAALGLNARLARLADAGHATLVLCAAVAALALAQNMAGIVLTWLFDEAPALSVFIGSAAYLGGHGTASAWAATAPAADVHGALEVGLGSATLGLLIGAVAAGPVAAWLASRAGVQQASRPDGPDVAVVGSPAPPGGAESWAATLLALAFCVAAGSTVHAALVSQGISVPRFLVVLLCAAAVTNVMDLLIRPIVTASTDLVGAVALNAFLAIAMLTLDWAALASHVPLLLSGAVIQTVLTCAIAMLWVFPQFGRDRDAVAASGGFIGFGLGAMPIGLSVMGRLNQHLGETPRAMLAVTLAASMFTDAANAVIIALVFRLVA